MLEQRIRAATSTLDAAMQNDIDVLQGELVAARARILVLETNYTALALRVTALETP